MAQYQDEDDAYAALLAPTFNPQDPIGVPDTARTGTSSGVAPVQQPAQPYAQGVSRPPDGGVVRSVSPPVQPTPATPPAAAPTPPVAPSAAVPAASAPSGNATSGPSLRDQLRASLARQQQSVQGAEANTAQLQSQPDEASVTAPLEAQRTQLAQPIDPNQQQYKPGIITRIARGFAGLEQGGIAGVLDPTTVGDKAYGAPNNKYDVDTAKQARQVAGVDQQISQAAQSYKAASERAKALAQEQRSNATGEHDIQGGINTAQKNDETYQTAISKLGQKEIDDPDNPGQKKLVDDPTSAAYQNRQDLDNYRKGMEQVAQLKAQVEKDKVTPGTPAWNQKQQEINAASQRANAYMGNYLQRSKNVDLNNQVLPGAPQIGNDQGNRTTVGTGNASTAIKNQANVAQFNDVHGALDSLEGSAKALVQSGGKLNSPKVAAALAQPKGTLGQWVQGEVAKGNMTPQERDYVIANAAAHENIQAMRKAAGGTATDASVAKLDALIPGASTPDLDYFLRQTGQIRSTAQRLGTGVTTAAGGSNLRNGPATNGGGTAGPIKAGEKTAVGPGNHTIVVRGGKWVDPDTGKEVK